MARGRWTARVGVALLAASAAVATASGRGAAAQEWQEEVQLRPTSVEAMLTHRDDGSTAPAPVVGNDRFIDPDKYVTVTVAHADPGGRCPGASDAYVTMTATRRDGGVDTLVAQCEGSSVDVGEAREAASARVRRAARLALPRAGFDPKVRGLVGLRTWLHVAVPDERLVSASVSGYEVRAVARPIAVEVTIDGVRQPVRLEPEPGAPLDAVGPFVFRRSGRHELSVRVMWMAEWVLIDDSGTPVRFGTIPSVPGPTITSQYPVVQAQALLR